MKKTLAMSSLLLAFALGSCSSDEPDNGGTTGGEKECGYVAVNIVQPSSTASRANDDGFEVGSDDENFANDATFVIFKADGTYLSTQTIPLKASDDNATANPGVEKIYNAVLVIDADDNLRPVEAGQTEPRFAGKIYSVLNAPGAVRNFHSNANKTETNLMKLIENCGASTKGAFIMSNSTYRDFTKNEDGSSTTTLSTEVTCGTPFTTADYFTTSNKALQHPVNIYVERVVAKVKTTKNGINAETVYSSDLLEGTGSNNSLTIRITGIEIANIAEKSYLFKNVDGYATDKSGWPDASGVWDATNKRCYWEFVPTIDKGLTYGNKSYNTIVGSEPTSPSVVYNKLADDKFAITEYVQPNTSNQKTSVLVTAQLLTTATAGSEKPADLVWIKGGYFTNDAAFALVCQELKAKSWAKKVVEGDKTIIKDIEQTDLEWARYIDKTGYKKENLLHPDLKDYQVVAQVKTGINVCKATGVGTADVKELLKVTTDGGKTSYTITDLNGKYDAENYPERLAGVTSLFAEVFKDGLCYYFVPIDQISVLGTFNTTPAPTKYEGVVRNHIYSLALNSIEGIGTAVFDPEETIIPVKPPHDEFYYLSAKINVLKWKFVSQTVGFEGNK